MPTVESLNLVHLYSHKLSPASGRQHLSYFCTHEIRNIGNKMEKLASTTHSMQVVITTLQHTSEANINMHSGLLP